MRIDSWFQKPTTGLPFVTPTVCIFKAPMPPSINKAYVSIGRGRRKLSAEGTLYKRAFKDAVAKKFSTCSVVKHFIDSEVSIKLHIECYFKSVTNKGYPEKAKNRYKRIDVSNRIKLLEDALFESLGIDDSYVFELKISKHPYPSIDTVEDFCNIRIIDNTL